MLNQLWSMKKFLFGALLNVCSVFLTFVIRLIIVRFLGVETLASFAVWQNNVTLASLIATLGQQNMIIKRFSTARVDQKRGALAAQIALILGLVIVMSFIVWAAFGTFSRVSGAPDYALTIWSLPAILIWALLIIIAPMHRSLGAFYAGLTLDRVMPRLLFLIIIVGIFALYQNPKVDLSILFTACLAVSMLVSVFVLHRRRIGWGTSVRNLHRTSRPWISRLGPFFFGATIESINARYPILVTSYFFAQTEMGYIVLMLTFLSLISIPTATMNLVLGPHIRQRIVKNPENKKLQYIYALAAGGLALLAAVVVWVIYPWFVEQDQRMPFLVIAIFSTSLMIAAICNAIIFFQFQAGSRYILNAIAFFVLVLRVIIGIAALNFYGIVGLGMAEIVANSVLLLLLVVYFFGVQPRHKSA